MQPNFVIESFWVWFQDRKAEISLLANGNDAFWDVVLRHLKQIDEDLWFELSEPYNGVRDFVVTTEGDIGLFPLVEEVINRAPQLVGWQFLALKPPMGFDFVTKYEGTNFDPRQMWFLPLESASHPQDIGLRIGMSNYSPTIQRKAFNATKIILETALGERVSSEGIHYVEVVSLPSRPEQEGFVRLPELPAYIAWRNKKKNARDFK